MKPIELLLQSFSAIYKCAHPDQCLFNYIPQKPVNGRLIVIGAGKASAAMAAAFEEHYNGDVEGIVVTRYGHAVPTQNIRILEAAHPVPDNACVNAVNKIIELLESTNINDTIICLISGGGSSLLTAPVDGLSFEALQDLNKQLLKSGAPIQDMNIVRKHLNKALGGGLTKYSKGAKMITLAISDVIGDDPSIIASGATVGDPSTCAEALAILEKYNIDDCDKAIIDALLKPENETPKPNAAIFKNNEYHLIATPQMALEAAAKFWQKNGFNTYIFDTEIQGDTNEAAIKHVEFIKEVYAGHTNIQRPCALISGGETTVNVAGTGKGGPNTQFMLQAAIALNGHPKVYAMACDTDGIDGSADNAGAIITPDTLSKANEKGLSPQDFLENNDSYNFFKTVNGLVKPGPTNTNVNDYRVFLLMP